MLETENQTAVKTENQNNEPVKIASIGKVERLNTENVSRETFSNKSQENNEGANAEQAASKGAAENKNNAAPAPTSLNEEQIKDYFKSAGIEYEGIDKLKEKLNYKPEAEPTEEEKKLQALAKEKKLVDLYVANGGTVEQYVAIKNVAESDLSQLSLTALKKELKDAKFNDEEIAKIIKERYFQIEDAELEQYEDETEKEFLKRKKEYGANKLANRSLHTQKQAQGILKGLNDAIESENLQAKEEATTSANIDDYFKSVPRKLTFTIGEANGKEITPVEFEIPESDISAAQQELKDPAKRQQLLFNQDGSLNFTKISELVAKEKYLESAIKTAYHEGGSRQVEQFQKIFPAATAQELGIGSSPIDKNAKKQVAGFGKTQRVNHPQHN